MPLVNLHWKSHPDLSLTCRSAFRSAQKEKLLKWLQENIETFIMLNKRRRWFHSSREKLPLVSRSASWMLVSTYWIWIFGSKLILSRNLSSATLWVLDTCLIVGLRPLIIILITASLSSKIYDWNSPCEEECVCVYVIHIWQLLKLSLSHFSWCFGFPALHQVLLGLVYHVLECCLLNVTLQSHYPKIKSRQSIYA